jgi:hypothetical protein
MRFLPKGHVRLLKIADEVSQRATLPYYANLEVLLVRRRFFLIACGWVLMGGRSRLCRPLQLASCLLIRLIWRL